MIPLALGATPCVAGQPTATADQAAVASSRALAFLLKSQEADGAWGSPRNAAWMFEFWSNPETHRSWKVATTGLCCMALQQPGLTRDDEDAYDRGIGYVTANAAVGRPSDWDVDNTWAYVYGLQALALAHRSGRYAGTARDDAIVAGCQEFLRRLARYQTPNGGWGYYAFETLARRPAWATSFETAAALLAILDARDAGIDVSSRMVDRAVGALRRCRLPSGAYTYSVEVIPSPGNLEWIDQIKGSLSRIQVCNLALLRAGEDVSANRLRTGLERFFEHHRFLDVALKKQYPHEAYYLNSGYFYYFGHYYAAQVIQGLPAEEREHWNARLRHEVIKTQGKDGSMWDYYLHDYHKPYGTAFGLLTLTLATPEMERSSHNVSPASPAPEQGKSGPD